MTDALTAQTIRAAIARLRDDNLVPDRCPPHLVHPRYVGPDWTMVSDYRDGDVVVGCAMLCGTALIIRRAR